MRGNEFAILLRPPRTPHLVESGADGRDVGVVHVGSEQRPIGVLRLEWVMNVSTQ